jgi:toxin ParE1/3/4
VTAYIRTARAEEDLIEIWTYIARDNLTAADRVLDRIDTVCLRLSENPYLGPARPDLAGGLRYFVSGSYLVLYRIIESGVEVVRVVHGARDLPSLFRDA